MGSGDGQHEEPDNSNTGKYMQKKKEAMKNLSKKLKALEPYEEGHSFG
jgi:hypothetical protein